MLAVSRVLALVAVVVASACAGSDVSVRMVTGQVVAAPTCPVEPAPGSPPDPACSPAPVAEAELRVIDLSSAEAVIVTTDAAGRYTLELSPGTYRLEPPPLANYPGTPDPITFTVQEDRDTTLDPVVYDTGIR